VAHYHRTWGAALLVAGLAGGREPLELSLNERVEAARRMAAAGFSAAQIGEEVGVCGGTVGRYLRAHTCRCGRNWVVRATRCGQCAREHAALSAPPRWERADVIEALKRWGELEGCAPRSEQWLGGRHARGRWAQEYPEWPATATVVKLFGSWNAGLRAAGLEVNKEYGKWTLELAIAALRRDANRRGRSPTSEEWSTARRSRPHSATVEKLFGSWNAGLRAAGLRPNAEPNKWTPATVLEALRGLEQELGRQPTTRDLQRPPAGYPSRAIVRRKLGSWGAARRRLGWSCEQRVIATDEQMISALKDAGRELGAEFTHQDYKQISAARGWPSANAITARFGSWNEPRQLAGLRVSRRLERGWRPEQLARALRAAARRIGRTPLARDWDALAPEYGWPSSATVMRRLGSGSWVAAIDAAGLQRGPTRASSQEQVLDLLRRDTHPRGRAPPHAESVSAQQTRPTCHQVTRLFGSWTDALQAAILNAQPKEPQFSLWRTDNVLGRSCPKSDRAGAAAGRHFFAAPSRRVAITRTAGAGRSLRARRGAEARREAVVRGMPTASSGSACGSPG